jgi:hypothetical protein
MLILITHLPSKPCSVAHSTVRATAEVALAAQPLTPPSPPPPPPQKTSHSGCGAKVLYCPLQKVKGNVQHTLPTFAESAHLPCASPLAAPAPLRGASPPPLLAVSRTRPPSNSRFRYPTKDTVFSPFWWVGKMNKIVEVLAAGSFTRDTRTRRVSIVPCSTPKRIFLV